MPILFIDSSEDPEFDTWRGDLLRAAAQCNGASLSTAEAIRFCENPDDPEFDGFRREVEKAHAQSVRPAGALSPDDETCKVL